MDILNLRFPDSIKTDRVMHLLVCYTLTILTAFICHFFLSPGVSMAIGMVASMTIGFLKELYDKFVLKCYIDDIDLLFDMIGMALAAIGMLMFV